MKTRKEEWKGTITHTNVFKLHNLFIFVLSLIDLINLTITCFSNDKKKDEHTH